MCLKDDKGAEVLEEIRRELLYFNDETPSLAVMQVKLMAEILRELRMIRRRMRFE